MSSGPLDQIEDALADDSSAHDVLDLVDEAIERATREADAVTLAALADRLDAVATSRGGEWGMVTIAAMRARALATPSTGSGVAPARDMAGSSRRVFALLAVVVFHAFGALTWFAFLGFGSDAGTDRQLKEAAGLGAATWLVAAVLIVWLWWSGHSIWAWLIPIAWWFPSFILMIAVVDLGAPLVTPTGVLPPTTLSSPPQGTLSGTTSEPSSEVTLSGSTSEPFAEGLCKAGGIRYTGATAQGAEVCITLTPNRSAWVEIGFSFVNASGCPDGAEGTVQIPVPPTPLSGPGRIELPASFAPVSFTAMIRGDDVTKASGVFADSEICPGKKFKWNARLQP